jgi:hypothetical protein
LLAVQIMIRINQAFDVDLALGTLFQMPTVAELANGIAAMQYLAESESAFDEVEADEQESFGILTMIVYEILSKLNELGIVVRLNEDGNLDVTAPKGVMTAELAKEIKANKGDIVGFLSTGNRNQKPKALQPVLRVPRDLPQPISLGQERLWVLDCLEPGNPAYNMPILYRIHGPLNVQVLEKSINELIHRHESLRTTFGTDDGIPVQRIAPYAPRSLEIVELSACAPDEIEMAVKDEVTAVCDWQFDLAEGPLFLTRFIQISEQESILCLVFHHIISDGWSINLMADELSQLYSVFLNDVCSPLPELPIQYVDYAAWQREWLEKGEQTKQLAYWHDQLQDAPAILNLPTDHSASRCANASVVHW